MTMPAKQMQQMQLHSNVEMGSVVASGVLPLPVDRSVLRTLLLDQAILMSANANRQMCMCMSATALLVLQAAEPDVRQTKKRKLLSKADSAALARAPKATAAEALQNTPAAAEAPTGKAKGKGRSKAKAAAVKARDVQPTVMALHLFLHDVLPKIASRTASGIATICHLDDAVSQTQ